MDSPEHSSKRTCTHRYLNTAVLIALVIFSFTTLFFKSIRCFNKGTTAQYKPINQHSHAFYGATETPNNNNNSDQDNDDLSSSGTIVPSKLASSQPWSAYNWMRLLLSGTQLGFLVYMALSLNESSMDTVVEGRYNDLIYMYDARILFWVCTQSNVPFVWYIDLPLDNIGICCYSRSTQCLFILHHQRKVIVGSHVHTFKLSIHGRLFCPIDQPFSLLSGA